MKKLLLSAMLIATVSLFSNPLWAENPAPANPAAPENAEKAKVNQFTGEITFVDLTAGTMTLKHSQKKDTTKNFKCPAQCRVSTAEKAEATLADLKKGDKVLVLYTEQDGTAIAKKISPPKSAKKEEPAAPAPAQ